jgi:signal transduction histidine kinase
MVKKAITYYRSVGKDKALLDFCDRKGKFVDDELYITVYDKTGKCLSHGANMKMVGKDWSELKDSDGKAFIKERLEMAKTQPTGWQTYKWTNPVSKQIELKSTYFAKEDDVIFSCGSYRSR